jgi:signal transduction histidine kinase
MSSDSDTYLDAGEKDEQQGLSSSVTTATREETLERSEYVKTQLTSNEVALLKALARFAALMIERESPLAERSQMQLDLEWLDLNAIIRDIVRRIRPTAPKQRIRLQLANILPILQGNRDKLTEVVAYLLHSAIAYSPDSAEVRVTTVVEGNVVHVSVRDHGSGMPIGELERLCVRQIRAEPGNEYNAKRTGMDLSGVCEVVQRHGGHLWVECVPSEGSTFHFTIKFAD